MKKKSNKKIENRMMIRNGGNDLLDFHSEIICTR